MKHKTIIDVLDQRAINESGNIAYTFLADGEKEESHLTYTELKYAAQKIGGLLQSYLTAGERVLLLYPPGLDFVAAFFGSLYAGLIPIPAPQPRPNKTLNRLQAIAVDAGASAVLTTSSTTSLTEKLFAIVPELQSMRWLATDNLEDTLADRFSAPQLKSDGLALLQYTSGSTSSPKGVMITHENIMRNSLELDQLLYHTENTVFVTWLPHFHDMGLIYGIVQPLYRGFPVYILPSVYFLQRPVRWLEAITRYRGTHTAAPNFAYDLCVRKVTPEQRSRLDLRSWLMASNAAEPVSAQVIDRFTETFEPCGFRRKTFSPCYGLAEVTLIATGVHRDEETPLCKVQATALGQNKVAEVTTTDQNTKTLVSCGRTAHPSRVVIADPESLIRCQDDEIGEIWVQGESVAQGYWGRPEETEQTFNAYLADSREGTFLRTGDLGFIKNGELYVVGRLKDLIIIAGTNHHPQDIEETVTQSHPSLRPHCCAAFSLEDDQQELLVIVAEVEPHYRLASDNSRLDSAALKKRPTIDPMEVIKVIKRAIAEEHELPVYAIELIKAGTLPKTTSGKIQRRECKRLFQSNSLEKWEG